MYYDYKSGSFAYYENLASTVTSEVSGSVNAMDGIGTDPSSLVVKWYDGCTFQARDAYHILGNKRTTILGSGQSAFYAKLGRKSEWLNQGYQFHSWRNGLITATHRFEGSKENRFKNCTDFIHKRFSENRISTKTYSFWNRFSPKNHSSF